MVDSKNHTKDATSFTRRRGKDKGSRSNPKNSRPIRLLVVDDEAQVLQTLKEALTDSGYEVFTASSGAQAVAQLFDRDYDLIIADVVMPGLTGFEIADSVVRAKLEVPVVLITGHGNVEMARRAVRHGVSDFITKPFNINELPIVVERNLERKKVETQRLSEFRGQVRIQAVQFFAATIDAKDRYTAGHSLRVTKFSLALAEELNLSPETKHHLELAARVHDIGKIGIPDAILNKPGKLTNQEWQLVRKHPEIGSQIVSEVRELAMIALIIRHHHEKIDGTGYPDKLKGYEIPFLSRIIAIADTYEAMTSDRSYRPRFSEQEAIERLRRAADTQLDPTLVEPFITAIQGLSNE